MINKLMECLRLWLMEKILTEDEFKRATLPEDLRELLHLAIDTRVEYLEKARIVDFAADRGGIAADIADLTLMQSTYLYASFRDEEEHKRAERNIIKFKEQLIKSKKKWKTQ